MPVALHPARLGAGGRRGDRRRHPGARRGPRWPTSRSSWCSTSTTRPTSRSRPRRGTPATSPSSGPRRAGRALRADVAVPVARGAGLGHCVHEPSRARERAGWPVVEVVDRREEDPRRAGLFSPAADAGPARRPSGCSACSTAPAGPSCWPAPRAASWPAAATARPPSASRRTCSCAVAAAPRARWCARRAAAPGSRTLRAGVTRVREELEALVGEPVAELTAATPRRPPARRGSWSAPRRCCSGSTAADVVAFLDLDQELLGPPLPRRRAGPGPRGPGRPGGRRRPEGRSAGGRPPAAPDPAARPRGGPGGGPRRPEPGGRRRA